MSSELQVRSLVIPAIDLNEFQVNLHGDTLH